MSMAGNGVPPMSRLDWNESPLGPSPKAIARVVAGAAQLHHYPRGLREEVTQQVARYHGVAPDQVLLTNGVDEATDLVLSVTKAMWFVTPGFEGYPDRARALGREPRPVYLDDAWQPITDPADVAAAGGAVFLAQPHNPTGNLFRRSWVRAVAETAELVFLDETYLDFGTTASHLDWLVDCPSLLVFKSFSKTHSLAGVRHGAVVGAPALIDELRARQSFHSVNSIALHALSGALDDTEHSARLRRHVTTARRRYAAVLTESGLFDVVKTPDTNFVLARCRPGVLTPVVIGGLDCRGVVLYDCGQLGLDGWLRISIGSDEDLWSLTTALRAAAAEILASAGPRAAAGHPVPDVEMRH